MNELEILVKRLKRINIEITFISNYPFIYIDKINGKKVLETYFANHGFTIAFHSIKNNQKLKFTDLKKVFSLIRKYKN